MLMRKWLWVTGAVLIVLVGGGWYSVKQIEQSVATSVVSKVLSDPSIKKELQNINVSQITSAIQSVTQAQAGNSSAVSASSTGRPTASEQGQNSSSHFANGASSQKAGASGSTSPSAASAGQGHQHPSTSTISSTSSTTSTSPTGRSGQGSNKFSGGGTQGSGTRSSNTPVFTSRQQVISYALSHFTAAQIVHFAYLYLHKSHLTPADMQKIQDELLSHFSTSQLSAMATAWNAHP